MLETLSQIKEAVTFFQGTGEYLAIFFATLVYMIIDKEEWKNRNFLWYIVAVLVIVCFPLTANNIIDYWTGEENYWIIFYMLPMVILIAYVATKIICRQKRKRDVLIVCASFMFLLILSGTYDYRNSFFYSLSVEHNNAKVSEEIVEISNMFSEQENIKMVAAEKVCSEIREYNSQIKLLYGNDVVNSEFYGRLDEEEENLHQLYLSVKNSQVPLEQMTILADQYACNCVVIESEYRGDEYMQGWGYEVRGETDNYVVYTRDL